MIKTSLDHLPEGKQRTIEEIRRLIINETEQATAKYNSQYILCIVLFGSYARGTFVEDPVNGYISDFDILVTVNGKDLVDNTPLWYGIEEKADQLTRTPLNLIVHTHEEVAQKLLEGHYFFSDIRSEGVYLYTSKPDRGLPEPKHLTDSEKLPVAQQHYHQWFESSSKFLEYAGIAIGKSDYKEAAFFLHQATERFYACVLLVLSNYRPKTHNIERLRNMAIQHTNPDSPLRTIFAGKDRFQRRSFQRLKRAYIDARYSEHYAITQDELGWLANEVDQLKSTIKILCGNHISRLQTSI
jgi:HEPN domain-containing protein/predicted nucleotidyltransferase